MDKQLREDALQNHRLAALRAVEKAQEAVKLEAAVKAMELVKLAALVKTAEVVAVERSFALDKSRKAAGGTTPPQNDTEG